MGRLVSCRGKGVREGKVERENRSRDQLCCETGASALVQQLLLHCRYKVENYTLETWNGRKEGRKEGRKDRTCG